jgi:uncharacterized protein YdhG (YjbR/CyaY superfamily)
MTGNPATVEEYIASKPREARKRLEEMRRYLRHADPGAEEELKWGKPAFVNNGILYVYAAFKKHISLHPTPSVISAMRKDLEVFEVSENTIQFPLEQPIPGKLVEKIASLRVCEKNDKGIGWK